MRTYVSTLGFHETRVTRPILREGLDAEDTVILLRPEQEGDSDRGQDAVAHVQDMLEEIAPGAAVTTAHIDTSSFLPSVLACVEILEDTNGKLIVNFGGGAREIFLPLAIATVLQAPVVDHALQYTDIKQEVRSWQVPNLTAAPTKTVRETLRAVPEEDTVAMAALAERAGKSRSTVVRHVETLREAELVHTERHGKEKHVRLTTGGRLFARAHSY